MSIVGKKVFDFEYKLIYYGNTLCIKGKYDIKDYDTDALMINCDGDIVCIKGSGISIQSMDADEIYIRGNISNISFS